MGKVKMPISKKSSSVPAVQRGRRSLQKVPRGRRTQKKAPVVVITDAQQEETGPVPVGGASSEESVEKLYQSSSVKMSKSQTDSFFYDFYDYLDPKTKIVEIFVTKAKDIKKEEAQKDAEKLYQLSKINLYDPDKPRRFPVPVPFSFPGPVEKEIPEIPISNSRNREWAPDRVESQNTKKPKSKIAEKYGENSELKSKILFNAYMDHMNKYMSPHRNTPKGKYGVVESCSDIMSKTPTIEQKRAEQVTQLRNVYRAAMAQYETQLQRETHLRICNENNDRDAFRSFENTQLLKMIDSVEPTYSRKDQLKWYEEQEKKMSELSKYPLHWAPKAPNAHQKAIILKSQKNPKPIVFINIEIPYIIVGQIIFELRADLCPLTSEHFRNLCNISNETNLVSLRLDKVVPEKYWTGGYFGSDPDNSEPIPFEKSWIKHDRPGVLSMIPPAIGPWSVKTEFMITGAPLPEFNGKYIPFGRVIRGMDFLTKVNEFCKPSRNGKPKHPIVITGCGESVNGREGMKDIPFPKFVIGQPLKK